MPIFKANNKDTRKMSGVSIINFEHILHFVLSAALKQINTRWVWGEL